jgi:hypothetical protein
MIGMFTLLGQKVDSVSEITELQIRYNNAIDNAISDTMFHRVEWDNGSRIAFNIDTMTDNFFQYLAFNMGLDPNSWKGRELRIYVPIIAYILQDGFYISYMKQGCQNGDDVNIGIDKQGNETLSSQIVNERTDLIPFLRSVNGYTIFYTLTDFVKIRDDATGYLYEGEYKDIIMQLPGILETNFEEFDKQRRNTIVNLIKEYMNDYLALHNTIAKQYGISYQFTLPYIEEEKWYRTIDDNSMIAIFQGYPYGSNSLGYYNRIAIGGARIAKTEDEKE